MLRAKQLSDHRPEHAPAIFSALPCVSSSLQRYLCQVNDLYFKHEAKSVFELEFEPLRALQAMAEAWCEGLRELQAVQHLRLAQARYLWEKLGDVPVTDKDEIDEDFLHFARGTSRHLVYDYFEVAFQCSVVEDLMFSEHQRSFTSVQSGIGIRD